MGILQVGILEWVAVPFSRESSRPRNLTGVSCIAGGFFTSWATRQAHVPVGENVICNWIIYNLSPSYPNAYYKSVYAAAAAKSLQLCPPPVRPHRWQPTRLPCPWDSPGRTLEWVAISFSSAWKWKVKLKLLSHVRLLVTPWTAAYQAPPAMGFSRQEYWSG